MNTDGTDPVPITHGDNSASDAAWSPDGRRIAFTRCGAGSCDIHVMNADGGGEERLTDGERPGEQDPTWSPDGRHIAFADLGGIVVMNADGQDWRRVTDGPADDGNPDWSPVGPDIAFDGRGAVGWGHLHRRPTRGSDDQPHRQPANRFESILSAGRAQDRLHAQAKPGMCRRGSSSWMPTEARRRISARSATPTRGHPGRRTERSWRTPGSRPASSRRWPG